jgi:hypothetical protein
MIYGVNFDRRIAAQSAQGDGLPENVRGAMQHFLLKFSVAQLAI